jgi:hypothetical protein
VADRGTSVRIPRPVAAQGHGYLEDRRPAANADPYCVAAWLLETVCDLVGHEHGNGQAGREVVGARRTGAPAPWRQPSAGTNEASQGVSRGE